MSEPRWEALLLKLLTVIAWADRTLIARAAEYLHECADKLKLTQDEWNEVAQLIITPPRYETHEFLINMMARMELSPDELTRADNYIQTLILMHPKQSNRHMHILQSFYQVVLKKQIEPKTLKKIKGFKRERRQTRDLKPVKAPSHARMAATLIDRIMGSNLREKGIPLPSAQEELQLTALLAEAFVLIAWADGIFKSSEQHEMEDALCDLIDLDADQAAMIVTILREESTKGISMTELGLALKDLLPVEEKRAIIKAGFRIATADHELLDSQVTMIRDLSKALGLPTYEFNEVHDKALWEDTTTNA